MIGIKVGGPKTRRALISIDKAQPRLRQGIRNGLFEVGRIDQQFLRKEILKKNKTGRLYRYKGRLHRASAPYEFPANRSGKLRKSVDYKVRGHQQMEFGVGVEYGKWLEHGTKKMKPRSQVLATVRQNQRNAVNALLYHTNRTLRQR